jgi:hypothetical protein
MTAPVRYQSGRTIRERGRRQPLSNRTRLAPAGTFAYGPKPDGQSMLTSSDLVVARQKTERVCRQPRAIPDRSGRNRSNR